MRLHEPRPRVHGARFDEVSSATPTGHWRIGRGNAAAAQDVDRITQSQLAIADILRSDAPASARIDGVTLETLADRLRTRMAKAA